MITLITDSMSDISQSEATEIGIRVIPLTVRFGTEEFRDGIDISLEDYYARMETVTELPKTSQVTPDSFEHAFKKELAAGNQVLCITGSSRLSGTYQSAEIAWDHLKKPADIRLVDSMNASHGEALLVFAAVKYLKQGHTLEETAAFLERIVPQLRMTGMARELKYLVMGGRISAGVGAIGSTLGICPMVKLEDGQMKTAGLCHGRLKARRWFLDKLKEMPANPDYPMFFAGAHCDDVVEALRDAAVEAGLTPPETQLRQIGPVIGTHTGPGLVSIGWVAAE